MTFAAKNTKNLTAPWTSWFFYGDSRSGKTSIAATFPKPLFIVPQNEGSHKTLLGRDIDYVEVTGATHPFNPKTGVGGMQAILQDLKALYLKDPNKFPYDTIVVDALSHYTDLALADFASKGADNRQVYGKLGDHLREINNVLRSMDVHVVYIALASMSEVNENATHQVGGPLIPGKTQFKLPAACEMLGYVEAGSGKDKRYRVHFERYKCFIAGARFGKLPRVIENFDFTEIEQYLTVTSSVAGTASKPK